jgi:hypothetical protein
MSTDPAPRLLLLPAGDDRRDHDAVPVATGTRVGGPGPPVGTPGYRPAEPASSHSTAGSWRTRQYAATRAVRPVATVVAFGRGTGIPHSAAGPVLGYLRGRTGRSASRTG